MPAYSEPDFVLTGWPNGDGTFSVAASDTLGLAEFTPRSVPLSIVDRRGPFSGLDLRVGMERLYIGVGVTYHDALRDLFAHWSPDPDRGPFVLPQPAKELTP